MRIHVGWSLILIVGIGFLMYRHHTATGSWV